MKNYTQNDIDTNHALDALIKKAEWMKDAIARGAQLRSTDFGESLRSTDFEDLTINTRRAFNAYTRGEDTNN